MSVEQDIPQNILKNKIDEHQEKGHVVIDAVHGRFRKIDTIKDNCLRGYIHCDDCDSKISWDAEAIKNHFNHLHYSKYSCYYCHGKVFIYRKVIIVDDRERSEEIVYHKCNHDKQEDQCDHNLQGDKCNNNKQGNKCDHNQQKDKCDHNQQKDKCDHNQQKDKCDHNQQNVKCEHNQQKDKYDHSHGRFWRMDTIKDNSQQGYIRCDDCDSKIPWDSVSIKDHFNHLHYSKYQCRCCLHKVFICRKVIIVNDKETSEEIIYHKCDYDQEGDQCDHNQQGDKYDHDQQRSKCDHNQQRDKCDHNQQGDKCDHSQQTKTDT